MATKYYRVTCNVSCVYQEGNWTGLMKLVDSTLAKNVLTTALNRLIAAEPDITNYDTIVGDGDCGIGLKRGSEGEYQSCVCIAVLICRSDLETPRQDQEDRRCGRVPTRHHQRGRNNHGRHKRRHLRHLPERARTWSQAAVIFVTTANHESDLGKSFRVIS